MLNDDVSSQIKLNIHVVATFGTVDYFSLKHLGVQVVQPLALLF